jgi:hypothetical protein
MVGDGDAMGVAGEIAEDVMGAAERGFVIDGSCGTVKTTWM